MTAQRPSREGLECRSLGFDPWPHGFLDTTDGSVSKKNTIHSAPLATSPKQITTKKEASLKGGGGREIKTTLKKLLLPGNVWKELERRESTVPAPTFWFTICKRSSQDSLKCSILERVPPLTAAKGKASETERKCFDDKECLVCSSQSWAGNERLISN